MRAITVTVYLIWFSYIILLGGAHNLTVTGLDCTGSHGFSVGSLGKKKDDVDEVSDLKFISNACHDCQNGVR